MDRVARVLRVVVVFLGLGLLLGAQGARIGSHLLPTFSVWWVLAASALLMWLTPKDEAPPVGRWLLSSTIVLASLVLLLFWRSTALHPSASLTVRVDGERVVDAGSIELDARNELRRLTGKRRNVTLDTEGTLEVPRSGIYVFELDCDDFCELRIGDHLLRAEGRVRQELALEAGAVAFSLHYRQGSGPARLKIQWNTPRAFEPLPFDYFVHAADRPASSRISAHLALVFFTLWWIGFAALLVQLGRSRAAWIGNPWVPRAIAGLLILYGSLLRFEALLTHSGLAETSDNAASIHDALRPLLPSYAIFNPDLAPEDPYRADVRSYLDRAGSMSLGSFYAPSFREPFYVLLAKIFVGLTGAELGILVESFVFSVLTLPLFAWIAAKRSGAWWAVALLLPVSLHEWLVLEAPTGYRMSAYGFFLLAFGAAALLALREDSGRRAFLVEGLLAGLVTLIRLSALSVVLPVLALRTLAMPRGERFRRAGAFLVVLALLIGPFLFSNYRAHGDPFYSVSFHTQFWLRAEGLDDGQGPVSFVRYFTDFGRASAVAKGTVLGMTVLPLRTFWNGLRAFPLLGIATLALGVPALFLWTRAESRLLGALYFGHLLPFAYIQNFPSGEMPRFVMPAFFFLVLAIPGLATEASSAWARRRRP